MIFHSSMSGTLLLTGLNLTLSLSAWWFVLAAAVVTLAAYFVYRYTLPPVNALRRTILWILRGVALVLLVLLLFEPVLRYVHKVRKPAMVAVLADRSASMGSVSDHEQRAAQLREFLASSAMRDLGKRVALRYFAFADSVDEVSADSAARMSASGVGTDLAGAWSSVEKTLAGENLSAVLIASDGAYNLGENPMRAASASTVPIYTIGIGDTSARADVAITEILTNEVVYTGRRIPLDARVRGHGLAGKSTTVHLYGPKGVEFGRQPIRFNDEDTETQVAFSFEASEPGEMRLTVAADSVAGEALRENNRRSVIVRILDRKSRVLLFAGRPCADLTVLRQTLEADTTYDVSTYVEAGGGKFLHNMAEPSESDVKSATLLVFVDFPTRLSSATLVKTLASAVQDKRVPLLFFTGPHVVLSREEALSGALPFHPAKQTLTEEAVLTRAAAGHSALAGTTPLPLEWNELPPVLGGAGNFIADGGAQVAMKLSRETLGMNEDEPGLVIWQLGARRGAAFLCWETSRWKLQLASGSRGANFYDDLLSRLRAWLVAPTEEQRVKIRTTKKLYSGGEKVRFAAQVYGDDLAPRDDAQVDVHVTCGARTESVPLRSRGNGRYEGDMMPWTEGEYRLVGMAVAGKDTLGTDRGLFAVEAFNIELLDTRARFDVLRQAAVASRGSFAPVSQADTLVQHLRFPPHEMESRREITLWNRAAMIGAIIALLACEWIIRKRSGML
jgi:hypothetical protein